MTLIVLPRAVFDRWLSRPWSEVEAAALNGEDGLRFHRVPANQTRMFKSDGWDDWEAVAFVRQGDPSAWGPDKTILFQQNF